MNKFFFSLILFLVFPCFIWSQQIRPTGLIIEEIDNIPKLKPADGKYDMLKPLVSLKPYCPIPGDQEEISSCVAWTVGYGALSIIRAIENQQTDKNVLTISAHSASFVYNQIKNKDSCFSGSKFSDAFELLKKKGDCLSITFKNSSTCNKQPSQKEQLEAAQFKVSDYARLFKQNDKANFKLNETRRLLAFQIPVMVGLQIPESFWSIEQGQEKWLPNKNENNAGFHAMVIVGYDDYKKEFELMNSFGASWGNNGFIKLSYADYARLAVYGFVMTREEKVQTYVDKIQNQFPSIPNIVFGLGKLTTYSEAFFSIREVLSTSSKPQFSPVGFTFSEKEQIYISTEKQWKIGDAFQIVASRHTTTLYIYVIGKNGQNHFNILFEKNDINPFPSSEIIIPHKNSIYEITERGDNHLCILVGPQKIKDIHLKVNQLSSTPGTFTSRIQHVFKDVLSPNTQISYAPHTLYGHAFADKKTLIPFFIKKEVK